MKTASSRQCHPPSEPHQDADEGLSQRERSAIYESGYRHALFQAWFATALEQTKSIFTLASAAVGLSLSLIFGAGNSGKTSAAVPLLLAAIVFSLSAVLCIWVFRANGHLVRNLLKDRDEAAEDKLVGRLDLTSRISFGAGLVFLILSAIAQIWP